MHVELITTGTELLLGRVLNTNGQWLCRKLSDAGYQVARQLVVEDSAVRIQEAVRESLSRADLVITTGGLGPTSDDLTRDCIAQLVGRKLIEDSVVLAHLRNFFETRKRVMPDRTRVQALVPEGGIVLANSHGTAPGLALEVRPNPFRPNGLPAWIIMLPGPPRELRPMYVEQVEPLLQRILPLPSKLYCETLRTTGVPESIVEEKIHHLLAPLVAQGLQVGYCARPGQVDVRLAACGGESERLISAARRVVQDRLGAHIYEHGDEEIEHSIVRLLSSQNHKLAIAESCTGGLLAHRVTNVPGASAVFLGGFVTYSNEMKQEMLGVNAQTLVEHGAVSEPVAREMAEGARKRTGADYALSVTGIAGPTGGSPAKPVGTVFIALATALKTACIQRLNTFDRETFKQVTAQQAMEFLRQAALRRTRELA